MDSGRKEKTAWAITVMSTDETNFEFFHKSIQNSKELSWVEKAQSMNWYTI